MKDLLLSKLAPYLPASYKILGVNFLYTSFLRILIVLFGFANLYFLTRSITKEELGIYYFVLNVLGVCWIFALPGMQNAIMQNASRLTGSVYSKASNLSFIFSILGSIVLFGFAFFYQLVNEEQIREAFMIAAFLFPFFKGLQHWKSILAGREQFKQLTLLDSALNMIMSTLMISSIILFHGSLLIPLFVILVLPALQNVIMTWKLRRELPDDTEQHDEYIEYGFKTSAHLAVGIISQHLDKILIFTFLSPASLAIYVAGNRFAEIAKDAMQDLATVITPRLARTATYTPRLHKIFKITAISYGVFLTIFAFTLLPWLVVFVFGEQYSDSVPYAQALILANAIGNLSGLQFRYVRSQLDQQAHKEASLYIAITQIGLSVALIPTCGLMGAVIAAYCNKIALMIYMNRVLKKRADLHVNLP